MRDEARRGLAEREYRAPNSAKNPNFPTVLCFSHQPTRLEKGDTNVRIGPQASYIKGKTVVSSRRRGDI
jgi:hypothetical protein